MNTTTYTEYKEKLNNFVADFNTNDQTETYHYDRWGKNIPSRKFNPRHNPEFFTSLGWQVVNGEFNGKYIIRTANAKSSEFSYYRYYILEGSTLNYKVYRVNIENLPVKVAKAPWKGKNNEM